jgi:hypothetical protein
LVMKRRVPPVLIDEEVALGLATGVEEGLVVAVGLDPVVVEGATEVGITEDDVGATLVVVGAGVVVAEVEQPVMIRTHDRRIARGTRNLFTPFSLSLIFTSKCYVQVVLDQSAVGGVVIDNYITNVKTKC